MSHAYFLYFPFTRIQASVADRLKSRLKNLVLVTPGPVSEGEPDPWLTRIRLPGDLAQEVARHTEEYRKWALLHGGEQIATYGRMGGKPFLFDPEQASQIRSDLTRRIQQGANGPRGKQAPDTAEVVHAGIFLHLAGTHDMEAEQTDRELDALLAQENRMMANLRADGEDENTLPRSGPQVTKPDPGRQMPEARLAAWAVLCRHLEEKMAPMGVPVFITVSETVFSQIQDGFPHSRKIADADRLVLNGRAENLDAAEVYEKTRQWLKIHAPLGEEHEPAGKESAGKMDVLAIAAHPEDLVSCLARPNETKTPALDLEQGKKALALVVLIRE